MNLTRNPRTHRFAILRLFQFSTLNSVYEDTCLRVPVQDEFRASKAEQQQWIIVLSDEILQYLLFSSNRFRREGTRQQTAYARNARQKSRILLHQHILNFIRESMFNDCCFSMDEIHTKFLSVIEAALAVHCHREAFAYFCIAFISYFSILYIQ